MITVYKCVVFSKNIMFLKYILFAHRNDYCIQMLLSGKTEVASPEKLSGHNQHIFRILEYNRIPAPDSIFYSELHRYVVTSGYRLAGVNGTQRNVRTVGYSTATKRVALNLRTSLNIFTEWKT